MYCRNEMNKGDEFKKKRKGRRKKLVQWRAAVCSAWNASHTCTQTHTDTSTHVCEQ